MIESIRARAIRLRLRASPAPFTARTKAGGVLFVNPSIQDPSDWDVDVNPKGDVSDRSSAFNAVWVFADCVGTFKDYEAALDCADRNGVDWATVRLGKTSIV